MDWSSVLIYFALKEKQANSISGTVGMVHVGCLEEWLSGSSREHCELCFGKFKIVRTLKYTCCQSIWLYLTTRVRLLSLFCDLVLLLFSILNSFILLHVWFRLVVPQYLAIAAGQLYYV